MLSASQTTGFLDQQYIVNQWIDPYIFLYVDRDARKKELDTTISATSTGRLTERNIKKKKKKQNSCSLNYLSPFIAQLVLSSNN